MGQHANTWTSVYQDPQRHLLGELHIYDDTQAWREWNDKDIQQKLKKAKIDGCIYHHIFNDALSIPVTFLDALYIKCRPVRNVGF